MPNMLTKAASIAHRIASTHDRRRFSKASPEFMHDLTFTQAVAKFDSRNQIYRYMHHYFYHFLPDAIREHRKYFSTASRGFGEEAFHSMWYLLMKEFKPKRLLEIGVFRGQVISLWALIGKLETLPTEIDCISPFSAAGDTSSKYPDLDFLADVVANFRHFQLEEPRHIKALSTDPLAVSHMRSHRFDCIYIDGSHDYDVVLTDYHNSVAALVSGGLLIMDDSSLYTDFSAPTFSFSGHPGPSRVARDFADRELTYVTGVGHQNVYLKK